MCSMERLNEIYIIATEKQYFTYDIICNILNDINIEKISY